MFRSQIRSRLLERFEGQLFRQRAIASEGLTLSMTLSRRYATRNPLNKAPSTGPPPPSSSSPRITSTAASPAPSETGSAAVSQGQEAALRTAEMRDSALRAARLRRLAQREDRRAEEAKAEEEKRAYKRRYDGAARTWTATIIALPILLVTSYYLFDRLVLGKKPKSLEKFRGKKAD